MILSIISAIANNNEIGRKNELLWDLPIDMRHFRKTTSGHPVIMGQKTFESLGTTDGVLGRPLPNRRNIVLTLDKEFRRENCEAVYSLDELDELLKNTMKDDEEVFIIGGGQIYKLFIDRVDRLYITHVDAEFPDADTLFPIIDPTKWKIVSEDKYEKDAENAYNTNFVIYERK